MNIDKAIKTKENSYLRLYDYMRADEREADWLSIAALKLEKEVRQAHPGRKFILLPGETEK